MSTELLSDAQKKGSEQTNVHCLFISQTYYFLTLLTNLNNFQLVQHFDHRISWIYFKPF